MDLKVSSQGIRFFIVPSERSLGTSDTNYDNVQIKWFTAAGETIEGDGGVKFTSIGKLGALTGGLLNIADWRKEPSQEDLQDMHKNIASTQLRHKRIGAGDACGYVSMLVRHAHLFAFFVSWKPCIQAYRNPANQHHNFKVRYIHI